MALWPRFSLNRPGPRHYGQLMITAGPGAEFGPVGPGHGPDGIAAQGEGVLGALSPLVPLMGGQDPGCRVMGRGGREIR